MNIKIVKNGPYIIIGNIPIDEKTIIDENGERKYKEGKRYDTSSEYALCRCGKSKKHPFCDKTYEKVFFDGKETADKDPFLKNVKVYEGKSIRLEDCEPLCSKARFCYNRKDNVWDSTVKNEDNIAVKMSCDCPSGRLVMYDKKSNTPIEPAYEPSITLLKDSRSKQSGPLFIKGGIPIISSSNEQYKTRNRVTLCCCGKSRNKPFCDSSHLNNK